MSSSSWNPHFSNFIPNAKGGMQVDTSHKALKTPLQVPLSLKAVHMLPPGCAKIVSWVPDLILFSASSNPQWRGSSFQVSLYAPHTWSTGTVCVCVAHTHCWVSLSHACSTISLECLCICVATSPVVGQQFTYFCNRGSLLSHILSAVVHQFVGPGCTEGCWHSKSVSVPGYADIHK